MDQLLREFLAEAEELIEALFADIKTLRGRRTEGRARRELVGRIFRHAHTLKGSASAVELEGVGQLAHEFENLLDSVRMGRVALDDAALDAFEDSAASISESLSAVVRGEVQPLPLALVERLQHLASQSSNLAAQSSSQESQSPRHALRSLPEDIARSLSEYEEHRLNEAIAEGARVFIIAVNFDLATFDERFRELSDALAELGESVSTLPGVDMSAPDKINFRILYATESKFDELVARIARFEPAHVNELALDALSQTERGAVETGGEPLLDEEMVTTIAPLTTLVRVEINELDEMVSAAHELFTDTLGALDRQLSQDLTRSERTEMELSAARIRRRFLELEERLLGLRMVPLEQTLERAARAGQMAARVSGKEIDFETTGGDVRLDKSLADAVSDPLLHLLRNAVAHGIETADERTGEGKDARGHITLAASAEGSRVRLSIKDDGRGIDPQVVARSAVEQGLIAADETLTKQESLRLIFRPGFSTAAFVSRVSGRGVGLDVVERAIEEVGGELQVQSEPGAGTVFEMVLPTTLALVPSLLVHSAGHRYCIAASHIMEAGYVNPREIEHENSAALINWRGQRVPLFEMRSLLAQPARQAGNGERLHIVISHIAGREIEIDEERVPQRAAVVVDGWDGHREVLVRGLGKHAARWRGISGAAELEGGAVALILDLPRLLETAK